MAAEQKAVESTAREETVTEDLTEKDPREGLTETTAANAEVSAETLKGSRTAAAKEGHTETIRKEDLTAKGLKEGPTETTLKEGRSTVTESRSAEKEGHTARTPKEEVTEESRLPVSRIQEGRVTTERTSTTSAMKKRAESTR